MKMTIIHNMSAFDGVIPGKPISEYNASLPSAFDKLKTLLNVSETKYPDKIIPEDKK